MINLNHFKSLKFEMVALVFFLGEGLLSVGCSLIFYSRIVCKGKALLILELQIVS